MAELGLLGLLAFAGSLVMVFVCRFVALRTGYVARPRDDRWHRRPTALMGGVAIALTVLTLHVSLTGVGLLPMLVVGSGLMFLLGLIDDLVNLKPYTKLVVEIAIASLFVLFGYRLEWSSSLTLDTIFTMIWIVGLTNAFNLLDNMDGLCAGISLIAGGMILAGILLEGGPLVEARYLVILMGAIAGFLVYNYHPASIFMGDSGSLFIGLNLSVLTLGVPPLGHGRSNVLLIVAVPLFLLLIPILDTTLVTVSRLLAGRSAAQGGRDHSSHRLVAMGLSERSAVGVLWALALLGGLLAVALRYIQAGWMGVPAAVFALAMIIFMVYLARVRVYDEIDDSLVKSGSLTPFVIDFVYRRRVAEVVLDALLASIAYYAAYRLRFEGADFGTHFSAFLQSLPLVVAVQAVALFVVGGYRGIWRYFGLMDGVTFAKGVVLGTGASIGIIAGVYGFQSYSIGLFVIYGALLMLLLSGSRASFRLMSEFAHRRQEGPRLVIYGSGDVGASAVRDLVGRRTGGYRMLGFIDDDPNMLRARMQGFPVLGNFDSLASLIANGAVELVVITRLMEVDRLRTLESLCATHGVALARLRFGLDELVAVS